jgi:hypothetical protein
MKVIKGKPEGSYMQLLLRGQRIQLTWICLCLSLMITTGNMPSVPDLQITAKMLLQMAWLKKGWCGTDEGLRLQYDCCKAASGWKITRKEGQKPPVWESEEDFF